MGMKKFAPGNVGTEWRAYRFQQKGARMDQSRVPFAGLECQ